jgi:hypothetical protein
MNELTDIIREEIEKMVGEYSRSDNKELFRAELERLVILAQREQLKDDIDAISEAMEGNKT